MDANEAGIPKREVNQSSGLPCSSRPRQRGALTPPSQEHCHWQWTREQPPKPRQRGALPPSWNDQPPKLSPSFIPRQPPRPLQADVTREQSHRPWQRGVIQEQPNDVQTRLHHRSAVSPSVHEHLHATHDGPFVSGRSSPHMQGPTQKAVQPQECMLALPLHHIKSAFMDAWASLDDTLERNQSMFSEMQKEMETSRSETRALKEAALNEKEELEASKTEILRDLESASQQGARIENISQRVEHICTDLSVQLAELNHLQGQIDEEQAALLTTLINDPCKVGKTSENLEMDLESHEDVGGRLSVVEIKLEDEYLWLLGVYASHVVMLGVLGGLICTTCRSQTRNFSPGILLYVTILSKLPLPNHLWITRNGQCRRLCLWNSCGHGYTRMIGSSHMLRNSNWAHRIDWVECIYHNITYPLPAHMSMIDHSRAICLIWYTILWMHTNAARPTAYTI